MMDKYGMSNYGTNDGGERPIFNITDQGEPRMGPMPEWIWYLTFFLFGLMAGCIIMTLKYNP